MEEQQASKNRGRRQAMVGKVVSDKMDKTVVVKVETTRMHRLYRRYMKKNSSYYAHDETNQCGVGDQVEIESIRPLSKLKRWRVKRVVQRAEG